MPAAASEISRDDLLTGLRREGLRVSAHQLLRWHAWGLLPQPRREGLGRGKGTVSYYPRAAYWQAGALAKLLAKRRNLVEAGWGLWVLGFPVTPWARELLVAELEVERPRLIKIDRAVTTGRGRLAKLGTGKRVPRELERIRGVILPEQVPRVLQMGARQLLGSLRAEDYSEDDWSTLQDAAFAEFLPEALDDPDPPTAEEVAAGMQELSEQTNIPRVIEALKALSDRDLEQGRNEAQWLTTVLTPPELRTEALLSRESFLAFLKVRHMQPDGELGVAALMRAFGHDRPPPSPLQQWLVAHRAATSAPNPASA